VREPIDRALSLLFFFQTYHDQRILGSISEQVYRFLESDGDELGEDLAIQFKDFYVNHFSAVCSDTNIGAEEDVFSKAVQVVSSYEICGFYEEFNLFISQLKDFFCIEGDSRTQHINKTPKRLSSADISDRLYRNLSKYLEKDLDFYSLVKKEFSVSGITKNSPDKSNKNVWLPYRDKLNWARQSAAPCVSLQTPNLCLLSAYMSPRRELDYKEDFEIIFELSIFCPMHSLNIGIQIFDSEQRTAFGVNTKLLDKNILNIDSGTYLIKFLCSNELSEGDYTVTLGIHDENVEPPVNILWLGEVINFRQNIPRKQNAIGFSELHTEFSCQNLTDIAINPLVIEGSGSIEDLAIPLTLAANKHYKFKCLVQNNTENYWRNYINLPVSISYQWLCQRTLVDVGPSLRTVLDDPGIEPLSSREIELNIQTPELAGDYVLKIMPVQDGNCWFDSIGFEPSCHRISIII
jgi:hypothetical protein